MRPSQAPPPPPTPPDFTLPRILFESDPSYMYVFLIYLENTYLLFETI